MEHFYKGFQNLVNRFLMPDFKRMYYCAGKSYLTAFFFLKKTYSLIAVFWKNSLFFDP